MKKYIVQNKKPNGYGSFLLLGGADGETLVQSFPRYFANAVQVGDQVYALGYHNISRAWVCRDDLCFAVEPLMNQHLASYVVKNFDFWDGIRFRYALARALMARDFRPSLSTTANLYKFLQSQYLTKTR